MAMQFEFVIYRKFGRTTFDGRAANNGLGLDRLMRDYGDTSRSKGQVFRTQGVASIDLAVVVQ